MTNEEKQAVELVNKMIKRDSQYWGFEVHHVGEKNFVICDRDTKTPEARFKIYQDVIIHIYIEDVGTCRLKDIAAILYSIKDELKNMQTTSN